jgi:hypothetical protein
MKETNITDMEVNWLYSALNVRQPIDPTHLMINGVVKQHQDQEILVRGATSLCWLFL